MVEAKHYLAYIAGLVASDGTLIKCSYKIKITTSNKSFAKKIKAMLRRIGYKAKIYSYRNTKKYEVYVYSKKLASILIEKYKLKYGKKSKDIEMPLDLDALELLYYIKGLYDGDSSIYLAKVRIKRKNKIYKYLLPRITYKTQSIKLYNQLLSILKEMKLTPYGYYDRYSNAYCINLDGIKNILLFNQLIGYLHPCKRRRLKHIIEKINHIRISHLYYLSSGPRRRRSA